MNSPVWSIIDLATTFWTLYLKNSHNKLTNKPIISGDFNLKLIKYMQNRRVNQFLEKILSNSFIPQITLPTRITEKTATLIDNIHNSYKHNSNCVSGNITTNISDHFLQFLIIKNLKQTSFKQILQSFSGAIKCQQRGLQNRTMCVWLVLDWPFVTE